MKITSIRYDKVAGEFIIKSRDQNGNSRRMFCNHLTSEELEFCKNAKFERVFGSLIIWCN